MHGWFVTGTDTQVGKTVVCAALAVLHPAVYIKPVQSGAADGEDDAADVAALADVPTVTGAIVGPSLDPGVAVRRGRGELTRDDLAGVVHTAASEHPDATMIVEGSGGLLSELGSDGTTGADLAAALGLPVVVVAATSAGALNHLALTMAELDRRKILVAGVVACARLPSPDHDRWLIPELHRRSESRLAGVVPELVDPDPTLLRQGASDWLSPSLGGRADPARWR